MKIYELEYPSPWLNITDQTTHRAMHSLFNVIEWELSKAVMALHLYENHREIIRQEEIQERQDWEKNYKEESSLDMETRIKKHREEGAKRRELEEKYEQKLSGGNLNFRISWEQRREMDYKIEIDSKRKKWQSGVIPRDYKNAVSQLYVQAFISAIDLIGKAIDGMCEEAQGLPEEKQLNDLKDRFYDHFKDLRYVRDSIQHFEDRWRQLKKKYGKSKGHSGVKSKYKNKEPMDGSLVFGFSGNSYGLTTLDGDFRVEISHRSLEAAQDHIQSLINIFTWQVGGKEHYPT